MRILAIILTLFLTACTTVDLPDNWAPITTLVEREKLPGISDAVVTTISPYLFVTDIEKFWERFPKDGIEYEALRRHEVAHAVRQESYSGSKASWLIKYSTDSYFRWQEEQKGYKEEITYLVKKGRWWPWRTEVRAKTLSGPVYMNMTTYGKAKLWIEQVVKDARQSN